MAKTISRPNTSYVTFEMLGRFEDADKSQLFLDVLGQHPSIRIDGNQTERIPAGSKFVMVRKSHAKIEFLARTMDEATAKEIISSAIDIEKNLIIIKVKGKRIIA